MFTRPAAVAGTFYDDQPSQLREQLDTLLEENPALVQANPKVLVVPHAGHMYSGPTAATAFNLIPGNVNRVVLLGPSHRVPVEGMALSSADFFATPLGEISLDHSHDDELTKLPFIKVDDEAHRQEHSLEVQLPFLQTMLEQFELLPVVVGHCEPEQVAMVLDKLWGDERTLILISTDLSHFHSYEEAQQLDSLTALRILNMEQNFTGYQACGHYPLNGLLMLARHKSLLVNQLDLRNSGDTAGPKNRVVGYGAFALAEQD